MEIFVDCDQSLHKSVERPSFLRQSYFVKQTNKTAEGGLGREEKEGSAPVAVTDLFCHCRESYSF